MSTRRLVHLNGPPGVGKSTLAARWAAQRPGVLVAEVDVVRALVSGVEDDHGRAGALVRPAALAMISAYLEHSGDVVLPQLIGSAAELARFRAAAVGVGAEHVHLVLLGDPDDVAARFRARATDLPHHRHAAEAVAAAGGAAAIRRWHDTLMALAAAEAGTRVLTTTPGDVGATYADLVALLEQDPPPS